MREPEVNESDSNIGAASSNMMAVKDVPVSIEIAL